jgi:hypothetical protein
VQTREITIEGIALKIAPTPVVHMADVERLLKDKQLIVTKEGRDAMIEACFYGIRRTKKDCPAAGAITLEWLRENIDADNVTELIEIFKVLNFVVPQAAGEPPPGEAQAGAES